MIIDHTLANNMDIITFLSFFAGLGMLVAGAEALVRGASWLARALSLPSIIIGLTVVAFGTSLPEMAVSVISSIQGQSDISLGNVVGSNIFNVLFILGLTASIRPLIILKRLIRLDVPVMIGVSLLMLFCALNGRIGRGEGLVLFLGIIGYTVFLIYMGRKNEILIKNTTREELGPKKHSSAWLLNLGFILGGLVFLVAGSRLFVDGAISIAEMIGVSKLVIGLTIVAAGTSLPEVATSVVASIRGHQDIAVGNVIGSNIFNILAVLGLSSLISPGGLKVAASALRFDIPVMLVVAIACLPIFFTGRVIARWEGLLFLFYYLAYAAYLIFSSAHHKALPLFSMMMVVFVIPITVLTLLITTLYSFRKNKEVFQSKDKD